MHIFESQRRHEVQHTGHRSLLVAYSGFMFRIGLALETFDIVRPHDLLLADYFFFVSLALLLWSKERRLLRSTGSGVLMAGALILCGALLSLVTGSDGGDGKGSLLKLFILFGLFAPLAVVHSKNIRANLFFLVGGISLNCIIAMLTAWVSPDIADALAINPKVATDAGQINGRFAGMAGHPVILGLCAALAVLIGIGLLLDEKKIFVRWGLILQVLICALGALLTGSRTFLVSLIPALIVFALSQAQNRRLVFRTCLILVALGIFGAGVNYVAPDLASSYADRLTATDADDTENYGRLLTAGMALFEISQKPILGWGVERFGEAGMLFIPEDNEFMPAHMSFLQYWYAEGLLGAIGFLLIFVLPVRRMLQILKTKPPGSLANALRLGLSAYLLLFVTSNLHPILLNRFLYVPLFLFAGLVASARAPASMRKSVLGGGINLSTPNIPNTQAIS